MSPKKNARRLIAFMQVSLGAWCPTPAAAAAMPEVARQMNSLPKIVFSLFRNDLVGTIRQMKADRGPDMAIPGSGSIVTQLVDARVVDAIQVVVNPFALGAGESFFAGLRHHVDLTLTRTRAFGSGSVVLWYAPAG